MKDKTILRRAAGEEVELCFAIQERYNTLAADWLKLRGEVLVCPGDLKAAALSWRRMLYRFGSGDFQCTDDEVRGMAEFAQWTVTENCLLRNVPPVEIPRRQ